jgi:membrane protein YqaA with SNARE-associated domain
MPQRMKAHQKVGAQKGGLKGLIVGGPPPIMPRMEAWLHSLLSALALPQFGLTTVFVVSLVSATLLPMASVPAVFGLVKLNPDLFWPALLVATAGNTAGGVITYWMGYGAERAYERLTERTAQGAATPARQRSSQQERALAWARRFGAPACLLSWLPFVGDPLCAVAGWLRLPFWPCTVYMAIGKFLRYLVYVGGAIWFWPGAMNLPGST